MAKDGISKIELDTRKLDELVNEMPGGADAFLRWVAQQITDEIKLSFGSSPSPRGGPPGVDTGALRASMHWYERGDLEYVVSDGVEYGQYQELIYDRPFMTPVFESWRDKVWDEAARFGIVK